MSKSRSKSPENQIRRSQGMPSPKAQNSKLYLPSRYAQQRKTDKPGFQDILNSIQVKSGTQNIKNKGDLSPQFRQTNRKELFQLEDLKPKLSKFVTRPLKREKLDDLQFREIFLNPREDALEELRKKSSLEENTKNISKEYEKLLKMSKSQGTGMMNFMEDKSNQVQIIRQNYKQAIDLLEQFPPESPHPQQSQFYDNHIVMQPPDSPTSQNQQSSCSSGSIYAPSIPSNIKCHKSPCPSPSPCSSSSNTTNIKQLLMRARAGMNNQDVEKQAHLSHIIGEAYSQKNMYGEALKFQRRFLGLAKSMEDYIGMSLGANRVAISYYNCGDFQRSILFHNQNLKLSSNENCFVGFYNIGICYRKLNKFTNALEYFESAVSWARERGEQQSQCIALGQIGVTYQCSKDYESAIEYFQKSNQICQKIKKDDLKLHNLRSIIRIYALREIKPEDKVARLVEQAFNLANNAGKLQLLDIFRCNIGIVRGLNCLKDQFPIYQDAVEIQEVS